MSWLFGRGGKCTVEEIEKQRRKTMATEMALKSVEERKTAVLAKNPNANIQVFHNDDKTEMTAYDSSGNVVLARESHHHN